MASRSQPRYQPGDKIGGRYQVHQALMGGMGEVYLCLEPDQPFAFKMAITICSKDRLRWMWNRSAMIMHKGEEQQMPLPNQASLADQKKLARR